MRCPISPWNDSSKCTVVLSQSESNSHSQTGALELHRLHRCSSPRSGSAVHELLQMQRKLSLLLLASSRALVADRSQDHQYPRHFALKFSVRVLSPRTPMGVSSAGLVVI